MLGLFARKPLFDAATTDWMFEVFDWALEHLGADVFQENAVLVLPDDRYFPGRAATPQEMAELVFGKVREYAGMSHWPFRVTDGSAARAVSMMGESPAIPNPLRKTGSHSELSDVMPQPILYEPSLVNNPEALVGAFAQALSWHLIRPFPVPGGEENRPQVTELVAVFLGFGVIMANSAYLAPKRSCGSCGGPSVTRQSFLSQFHMTYALAIFCVLKGISAKQALPSLKSPLRGYFKRAMKEVAATGLQQAGVSSACNG